MNDVNQIRIPQNKIIAETKIRKEIDNLYQKIKRNKIYISINLPSEIEHYFNKPKANRIENEYFILDETQEDYADEIKHLITHYLKYLNKQETKIKNVFGINEHKLTIDEIALSYNLSRQRINEIKLTALAKLKAKLKQNQHLNK
jgi:DNA-directed RNA polymerase sigma subunit (sigma70/sigma32)